MKFTAGEISSNTTLIQYQIGFTCGLQIPQITGITITKFRNLRDNFTSHNESFSASIYKIYTQLVLQGEHGKVRESCADSTKSTAGNDF